MGKGPFKLRSGNTTPFKQMGSSPAKDIITGRKRIYDPKTNTTKVYNRKGELVKTKHHDKKTEKQMEQDNIKKEQVKEKKVEEKVEEKVEKDTGNGEEKQKKEGKEIKKDRTPPTPEVDPTEDETEEVLVMPDPSKRPPGWGLDR